MRTLWVKVLSGESGLGEAGTGGRGGPETVPLGTAAVSAEDFFPDM